MARVGLEPTRLEVLNPAGLPVAYRAVVAAGPSGIEPDRREIWSFSGVPSTTALSIQSAPGELNPVARAPKARGVPSSSTPSVRGEGLEPSLPGSEPGGLPISLPPSLLSFRHCFSLKVRGEGLEPSQPDSKSGSLPLADPRECPAGVEPACPGWEPGACPLGQGYLQRKERESNPQGLAASPRFERGAIAELACPSVCSCPGRTRTCNRPVNSRLLYR